MMSIIMAACKAIGLAGGFYLKTRTRPILGYGIGIAALFGITIYTLATMGVAIPSFDPVFTFFNGLTQKVKFDLGTAIILGVVGWVLGDLHDRSPVKKK